MYTHTYTYQYKHSTSKLCFCGGGLREDPTDGGGGKGVDDRNDGDGDEEGWPPWPHSEKWLAASGTSQEATSLQVLSSSELSIVGNILM